MPNKKPSRRLRNLFEKIDRIIQQVAIHRSRPLCAREILADAWMLDDQDAPGIFIEPEYWRNPRVSRRVH
jgi:hypothetical protein